LQLALLKPPSQVQRALLVLERLLLLQPLLERLELLVKLE
jgi:hypothetical protein